MGIFERTSFFPFQLNASSEWLFSSFAPSSRMHGYYIAPACCLFPTPVLASSCIISQYLLHHAPADRMVKVLVLLKRLLGERPINFDQSSVQRPHELHPSHASKQLGDGLQTCLVA